MTEERWRSVAIVLGVVLVVLVGVVFVTSFPSGSASPTASAGASIVRPSDGAVASPSAATPSSEPSESATPTATETPKPSPTTATTAGLATISFTGFKLDADNDPAGKARTFTFKTDGPGTVKAKLTGKSPQGTSTFCLKVGSSKAVCRAWKTGQLTGTTSAKGQTTFVVTAIGVGTATPVVDVAISFRAREPSVTLTNGRFDGKPADGYNGMSGKLKVRSGGTIAINATWGSTAYDYTYSVVDLVSATGGGVFPGNGTGVDKSDTVTPSQSYGFSLVNSADPAGPVKLTMTMSWR